MISAWYGGLAPALVATVLASFASIYLFSEPIYSVEVGVADLLRVSVFFAVAVLISALSAARRRAEEGLRAAHAGLEQRVADRTRELAEVNEALRREIAERQRAQAELVEHETRLRDLAAEVVLAEQRERRRLAAHLHDEVGQILALSQIRLARLRQLDDPDRRESMSDALEGLLEEAISRTRSLTCELSPPVLYELGLEAALRWLAEQFGRQSGVAVAVERQGQPPAQVSEDVRVTLFQVARELLANVAKHARASRAKVALHWQAGEAAVVVEDDGVGFEAPAMSGPRVSDSFGLFSIRERLRHQGGKMEIDAGRGRGSRITVRLPVPDKAPPATTRSAEPDAGRGAERGAERSAEPGAARPGERGAEPARQGPPG
jgi:signal transduction histidine kinase